ncbi:MAG: hypothetical protein KAV80_01125 [Methanomicrobia archaeon]|nr:hypothetical protein [Methanomicrobia archaeon]
MTSLYEAVCLIFVGWILGLITTRYNLGKQLFHDDRKKAYSELWNLHEKYKREGTTWANRIEELLNSFSGIFLEDIKPKLENKIEIIRKKYDKIFEENIRPIEEKKKEINRELSLKDIKDSMKGVAPFTKEEDELEKKLDDLIHERENIEKNFNGEIERGILSDIPELIKKYYKKL